MTFGLKDGRTTGLIFVVEWIDIDINQEPEKYMYIYIYI